MFQGAIVFCRLTFAGFHCWPDAPDEHAYLRVMHRHLFHVRVEWAVTLDRQIEFIEAGSQVASYIRKVKKTTDVSAWSCERWAVELLEHFGATKVEVSEDGENGAVVFATPVPASE